VSVLVGLETSTEAGSVALAADGRLLGELATGEHTKHAESLLPALESLLRDAGVGRHEISGVVVGAGPGSFTGVRIAAATARGLIRGLDVPLLAFSSLAALALAEPADGTVCALLDARRGEVYAACYDRVSGSDRLETLLEPTVLTVDDLLDRLPRPLPVFVGAGADRYADGLQGTVRRGWVPRASALLRLAHADAASGRVESPAAWEPMYLRASGAERGRIV
jgi:tRNA threonylcarbamoyladenosine biosynthesis protein TsaB